MAAARAARSAMPMPRQQLLQPPSGVAVTTGEDSALSPYSYPWVWPSVLLLGTQGMGLELLAL